jgi:hypothetical protein
VKSIDAMVLLDDFLNRSEQLMIADLARQRIRRRQ